MLIFKNIYIWAAAFLLMGCNTIDPCIMQGLGILTLCPVEHPYNLNRPSASAVSHPGFNQPWILWHCSTYHWKTSMYMWIHAVQTRVVSMINYTVGQYSQLGFVKSLLRTSVVAQWLRIHLPMQGTRIRALLWEDPTCCGATKPVRHNYWVRALEPTCHTYWSPSAQSPCSATREATAMRIPRTARKSSPRSPQLEKARMQQRRPNAAKNK